MDLTRAIPMRWEWDDPAMLEILRGTPVDCLVIDWATGQAGDAARQAAFAPLIAKAKAAGLSVAGLVKGSGAGAAAPGAKAAGLDAVLAEGAAGGADIPVLPVAERGKLPWSALSPVLVASDAVWPGIASAAQGAEAGPTADPWIDSNGWALRLCRARAPSRTFWLLFDPPAKPAVVRTDSYVRAIADACSFGGWWVVSLDENLRAGLAARNARSLEAWKTIAGALAFFRRHREWTVFEPLGVIGVISDFSGPDEMTGTELLNLLGRRNVPHRIIEKAAAATARLDGYKALVCVDEALPEAALRRRLLVFAQQGGVLVVSRSWRAEGGSAAGIEHPRIEIRTLGKGKLGIVKGDSPDPYMVARDTHVLLGKAHDLTRFYNVSAFLASYTAPAGGPRGLMQITNYTERVPGDLVTVWFRNRFASARLWSLAAEAPETLSTYAENGGTCVKLPAVPTYAAVELEGMRLD